MLCFLPWVHFLCALGHQRDAGQLKRLNLTNTRLTDRGVHFLCKGLRQCASLSHLLLRRNQIGPAGAADLGEVLAYQGTNMETREDAELGVQEVASRCG